MTLAGVLLLALAVTRISEETRSTAGVELSGVTWLGGDRYLAVEDKDALAWELKIRLDAKGVIVSAEDVRKFVVAGRKDLEGCAFDPLTRNLWVIDEDDGSIRCAGLADGKELARAKVPDVYRQARKNRSLEGLSISPDGLEMWTANEDTLACDGPAAKKGKGGVVRLQRFVRKNAKDAWRTGAQYAYPVEPVAGDRGFAGIAQSGVSGLVALGKGRVLVLERECSVKEGILPSCLLRLYEVDLSTAEDVSPKLSLADGKYRAAGKKKLLEENTGFANYEGICRGPRLADGSRVLLLVSDGGNGAAENLMTLRLAEQTDAL